MCLIAFAYDHHPEYALIFAANRDEFYDRPTAPADFWPDHPDVLAGRDLKAGGTWMGVTRDGRFGAVTNYRDPEAEKREAPSRGSLVAEYLRGERAPGAYVDQVVGRADRFNGFSLLVGSLEALYYFTNHDGAPQAVAPGIHGLSNRLLDTPWPKVERSKAALARLLKAPGEIEPEALLDLLADARRAPDEALPATGVPPEWERVLSPVFIASPSYGTRSSTVLLIRRSGAVTFVERSFTAEAAEATTRRFTFEIEKKA